MENEQHCNAYTPLRAVVTVKIWLHSVMFHMEPQKEVTRRWRIMFAWVAL